MEGIGFMGCIPHQFEKEYVEHTLQFLDSIFPKFSQQEKVHFISVIHSIYNQRIDQWNSIIELNKNMDVSHYRKLIDDEIKKRDAILDRLGARDIVPEKLVMAYIG